MFIDNNGCKVDFCNVILIMMTNVGVFEMNRGWFGFGSQCGNIVFFLIDNSVVILISLIVLYCEFDESKAKGVLECMFLFEFRNCFDVWILFCGLLCEIILCVVDKEIRLLVVQFTEWRVVIIVIDLVCEWFVEKGYEFSFGAWLMVCFVEDKIKWLLLEVLFFGEFENGGVVVVECKDDGFDVKVVKSGLGFL